MKVRKVNNNVYISTEFNVGKTIWAVTTCYKNDNIQYVNIFKKTNNPFASIGNDYKDFETAVEKYKNKKMKEELKQVECAMNLCFFSFKDELINK